MGVPSAEALLLPRPEALAELRAAAASAGTWAQLAAGLASADWREQLVGAAALVLGGADAGQTDALWRAIDGVSWAAPQLVAATFLVDRAFARRAEARLCDVATRRPAKTIGALVRAYHRLPAPSLPVVAQLARHDRVMTTEEARIGVRGVDGWLDGLAAACEADERARWRRVAR